MSVQSHHKSVSLEELIVDPRVQRVEGVDTRRVNQMAAGFNVLALGTITVSHRADGTLVLLDGMHRVTTCRQVGYQGLLNAEVFSGLTLKQEAELFLLLNATKTPTVVSKFLARIVVGEEAAIAIDKIVRSHGWKIAPAQGEGNITAISSVERIYNNGGGTKANGSHADLLDRVLDVVTGAWEHDKNGVNGDILLAVAQLIGRFGPSVDTKKLVAEMQGTRPGILVGRARTLKDAQGGSIPAALAKILAGMHNRKRRSNLLPEWVWIR